MKKIALFICCFVCYSTPVLANKCDWATNTPADDANYKYLVAKSYSDSSASDAANKAERDIDNQIGRLFGTTLNVQSEFYSDETTSAGTTRSYERSIGTISLKGLERQKSDVDKESGGWVGCVQYRYSQKEFKQEKQRLANLPKSASANVIFNESVGDTTCKGVPVEIITTPSKAFVTIDNGKYQGESPIKFGNVCNGKHTLEITKENYSDVNESLIVPTDAKISKTLKRGTKKIKIRTSLGNSRIFINDVDYGKEPISFNAPFGLEQKITAKNSEAIDITRTVSFSKYSEPEYTFNMEKTPGKIDFSAFKVRNPDVKITVDGKAITGKTTGELSADDEHKIVFSKNGFFDIDKYLNINGGETTYYPSAELAFSKTPTTTSGYFYGLGVSGGQGMFGVNLDAGIDIKSKILYTAGGLQFNYIRMPNLKMNFDYTPKYSNQIKHVNTDKASLSYYLELAYLNLGVNITDNWTMFGIGTFGLFSLNPGDKITNDGYTFDSVIKSVFRYGIGIQYTTSAKKNGKDTRQFGVRLSYLTGNTNLSDSDIKLKDKDTYRPLKNLTNKNFEYPTKIDTINLTAFLRFNL